MKILYLDCGMGAAGDMLSAALIDLLPEPDAFVKKLNALDIPGVEYRLEKKVKCGIVGAGMTVLVDGIEEGAAMHEHMHGHHHDHEHTHDHGHHHDHGHTHDHSHGHVHRGMADIEHIVRGHLDIPEHVKDDVMAVYGLIADAESRAHGVPVTQIHFHEVGTMDAVADITAVCLLMDEIGADQVIASPVAVGSGQVKCAHGILPVPAPATAHILQGVPTYAGSVKGELCTPTGAALLKHFAGSFGEMPAMVTEKIGYGMGKKDFGAANCVRAMLGETADREGAEVLELSCNVDDMTAEEIGFAMDKLFEGGAREVFTVPIGMKKNRPGTLIKVICDRSEAQNMAALIFKYTTTIGIREYPLHRYVLDRTEDAVETPHGKVRRKTSTGYGVTKTKYEYNDLARIATEQGISLRRAREIAETSE